MNRGHKEENPCNKPKKQKSKRRESGKKDIFSRNQTKIDCDFVQICKAFPKLAFFPGEDYNKIQKNTSGMDMGRCVLWQQNFE